MEYANTLSCHGQRQMSTHDRKDKTIITLRNEASHRVSMRSQKASKLERTLIEKGPVVRDQQHNQYELPIEVTVVCSVRSGLLQNGKR